MEDIASSTGGFCAILSRDLDAYERSVSFTFGRPEESWSSLEQMYFGKRRASRTNLFLEPMNFADNIIQGDTGQEKTHIQKLVGALVYKFGF